MYANLFIIKEILKNLRRINLHTHMYNKAPSQGSFRGKFCNIFKEKLYRWSLNQFLKWGKDLY